MSYYMKADIKIYTCDHCSKEVEEDKLWAWTDLISGRNMEVCKICIVVLSAKD